MFLDGGQKDLSMYRPHHGAHLFVQSKLNFWAYRMTVLKLWMKVTPQRVSPTLYTLNPCMTEKAVSKPLGNIF